MTSLDIDVALNGDTANLIHALLQAPEDQWFDRKSGKIEAKALARPLVAFANAEGGVIAVGLDSGKIDAVDSAKLNDIRQAAKDFTVPPVRTYVREIETPEGIVVIINVAPGDIVHETISGDCYLRIGDESRKLRFLERQELEYDRGTIPFDGTPAPTQELSQEKIENYQKMLGSSSPEKALRARNLLTKSSAPTVAAYLLFGESPQQDYPNAYVRVLKYIGEDRGAGNLQMLEAGSDVRIEGTLPEQIERASIEIERLMPMRRSLGENGKFTDNPIVPRSAWLEGVVNAVTHRSYSIAGDHTRVEIFSNRIEITSPGRFPGIVDLNNPLSIHRHARNPRIARVLSDLSITQELGEGIRRIFEEMRRVGLSDPLYRQGHNYVRLVLMASDSLPDYLRARIPKTAQDIVDALRMAGRPLGTGEIVAAVNLARPTVLRHLHKLKDLGIVVWEGNSMYDPRASWRLT